MPTNYNFKENWYDIIVPQLNTPKVKNAIKKGILGYMNNERCECTPKLRSFKWEKNSSPADYGDIADKEMEWENALIDLLEKNSMIESFPSDSYDDDEKQEQTNPELEYEKYREEYLNPILEPFINNYKKTHMDSYSLIGGCHWWNPTFGLTLANIVMPNEKWRPKISEYHTTIVNSDNTKIFDILYFDETETKSFGGDRAYENASMTLDEIQERNIKENKINREKKVNNCEHDEIYDPTFNQLYTELDDIEKNITKMETTLEGLTGMFLNKTYDDEEKDFRIFVFNIKIIEELFPNAKFEVSINFNDLNNVITTKKEVKLIQTFDCWHYESYPKIDKTFIIKSNKPMTRRYIINELIKQDFSLDCEHRYLESLEVYDDGILEYGTGS